MWPPANGFTVTLVRRGSSSPHGSRSRAPAATPGISRAVQPISKSLRLENLHWGIYLSPGGPARHSRGSAANTFLGQPPRLSGADRRGSLGRQTPQPSPDSERSDGFEEPWPQGTEPAAAPQPAAQRTGSSSNKERAQQWEKSRREQPAKRPPRPSAPAPRPTRGERRSARLPPGSHRHSADSAGCHLEQWAPRLPWMPVWWDMSHSARAPPPPQPPPPPPPRPPGTARPGPAART